MPTTTHRPGTHTVPGHTICPVCHRSVPCAPGGYVNAHPDTAGNRCLMSRRNLPR